MVPVVAVVFLEDVVFVFVCWLLWLALSDSDV